MKIAFSAPTFLTGLLLVGLFYLIAGAWAWQRAPETMDALQAQENIYTIAIGSNASLPAKQPAATTSASPHQPLIAPPVLPPAPIAGLYEDLAAGRLPVIRHGDGLTPFKAYRRPFDRANTKGPVVAIVVADLGLQASALHDALSLLPPDVSFDVSPYADAPAEIVAAARARGHEAWLTLPVESSSFPRVDTGAATLLIGASPAANQDKLLHILGRATGYAGLLTTADPAFLKSGSDMEPVVRALYDRGLGLADTSDDPNPMVATLALPKNGAYLVAPAVIDATATPEAVRAALAALAQQAKVKGFAAGVIHPLPVSLQETAAWTRNLRSQGITLAPLSALAGVP